ncbi:hypothetical protein TSOC_000692 [Tetrabaena socialis]|uniref:Uncharacterized protein n=1 Tax=Tetrabaena socialis TaxID=47790 RepID=A0A2J8AIU5_9CHLO|nr:hypothetical protein TSOC_000692 [Tetrabaena socialis]|eukprot:PNH12433.1 hypothetical protein TSOC_000692 [Tetrabaena socialis]
MGPPKGLPDYQAKLLTLTRNFANVTKLVKGQLDQVLNSSATFTGRHLLQEDFQSRIRIAVEAVLASPAAAPFVAVLRGLYDPAALPDLVASLYTVLQRLMAEHAVLRELMQRLDTHLDLLPSYPIFNPRTGLNLTVLADLVPFNKRTWTALASAARRRLQQADPLAAALSLAKLPPGFTAAPGSPANKVLVPLVFHVMTYRQGGGYGPPGWDRSADYVARMVRIANTMAFRSNFQFFINEVRFDPTV